MTRPSGWLAWTGPEVEGRLLGVPSVFIGHCPDPRDLPALDQAARTAQHVLFGPRFLGLYGWRFPTDAVARGQLVTLEITHDLLPSIPADLFPAAHVMVRLAAPDLRRLKPHDTVKLGMGHTGGCICFTWQHGVPTEPEAYDGDSPVVETER